MRQLLLIIFCGAGQGSRLRTGLFANTLQGSAGTRCVQVQLLLKQILQKQQRQRSQDKPGPRSPTGNQIMLAKLPLESSEISIKAHIHHSDSSCCHGYLPDSTKQNTIMDPPLAFPEEMQSVNMRCVCVCVCMYVYIYICVCVSVHILVDQVNESTRLLFPEKGHLGDSGCCTSSNFTRVGGPTHLDSIQQRGRALLRGKTKHTAII